jgi:oligopeptide/dipeptide ABC transporter ATP-binding protein
MTPLLVVDELAKHFPQRRRVPFAPRRLVRAVDGVSFTLARGETLALIGESGCGKSTVGRLVLRLLEPTHGRVLFDGEDLTALDRGAMRSRRRHLQMVFQDPSAALNPRLDAETIVGEPLQNFGIDDAGERRRRIRALFDRVGLPADSLSKRPFEFSGGQRQRLGLARALILEPSLVVADEPVSALDVSVQAQVLNLMADLQRDLGLAYLFISHDLAIVRHLATRVAVMYLGRIIELAPVDVLFTAPRHPYTQALLAAAPIADPRARRQPAALTGDVPSATDPPAGCPFHPRCPLAFDRCRSERPVLTRHGATAVACFRTDLSV